MLKSSFDRVWDAVCEMFFLNINWLYIAVCVHVIHSADIKFITFCSVWLVGWLVGWLADRCFVRFWPEQSPQLGQ